MPSKKYVTEAEMIKAVGVRMYKKLQTLFANMKHRFTCYEYTTNSRNAEIIITYKKLTGRQKDKITYLSKKYKLTERHVWKILKLKA